MLKNNLLDHSTQAFGTWLNVDKNRDTLIKIANNICKKMERQRLNLPGMPKVYEEIKDGNSVQVKTLYNDIYQELLFFLLKDEKARQDLLTGGPGTLKRLQHFLWHRLLDKSRSKESNQDIYKDTWRLFYSHTLDVMSKSDQFVKIIVKESSSKVIFFGRTKEPQRAVVLTEDLMDIKYPQNFPDSFQKINTKKNILKLADHFWNQAIQITQEPAIRITVRTFLLWIGRHVNLSIRIDSYPYPEISDNEDLNNRMAKVDKEFNKDLKEQNLTTWAQNFYHLLKDIEKKVFYYYECEGLPHKDISRLMGKKGNLSYQRDKIRGKLKEFLRPLDWISPEPPGRYPPDPADFIFFRDMLCGLLRSAIKGDFNKYKPLSN